MQNLEESKNWIKERLTYIAQNCDLKEEDYKRAYNSLKTALECVEKVLEVQNES